MEATTIDLSEFVEQSSNSDSTYVLHSSNTQEFRRYGYLYSRIFFSQKCRLFLHFSTIGQIIVDFDAGWHDFCVPDGTIVSVVDQDVCIVYHLFNNNG